jgi:hypothetical protein
MLKKSVTLLLSVIAINAHASCVVQSIIPDDQLTAIVLGKQTVFKTAHQYVIVNDSNHEQNYWLCNHVKLQGNEREQFEKEDCRHISLIPGKSQISKERLFREIYFNNRHPVTVTVFTTVEGDCKTHSVVSKVLKVH